MADSELVRALLRGAFDMHVHSSPDVLARKFNDLELARRTIDSGMAGFVLKSHYTCTADRATLIRELFPAVRAYGALTLNNAVGGLNPLAVDIAGRLGAKVVWFPTVDSANEMRSVSGQTDETKLPYWMSIAREVRANGIAGPWLSTIGEDGRVTEPAHQCLELIARYDMILATGHTEPRALPALVGAASEAGVERIVVTHPEFPTTRLSVDEQRALARRGVFFERCFTTPYTGKTTWEQVFENVRSVGTSSTILSTDLGQATAPYADEGLGVFIGRLLDAGFSAGELRRMVQTNAAQLLGAVAEVRAARNPESAHKIV